jgi:regulator of replication initiation timing
MQTNGTKQLTNSLELRIAALEEELVKQQSEFEQALSELVQDTEKALQQKVEKENLNKSLRAENSDLAAELDAKDSQAAQEHIEEAITHASEAPSTVADNEIKQLIAAPFADIVTGAPEELKLLFKKVREPEDDYQWNFEMEAQITDFIATHENSRGIELDDVKCNVGICEIKGFETEFNAWRKVIIDMESQPWWQFKNSSSRTTDENQEYLYFYLLAAL